VSKSLENYGGGVYGIRYHVTEGDSSTVKGAGTLHGQGIPTSCVLLDGHEGERGVVFPGGGGTDTMDKSTPNKEGGGSAGGGGKNMNLDTGEGGGVGPLGGMVGGGGSAGGGGMGAGMGGGKSIGIFTKDLPAYRVYAVPCKVDQFSVIQVGHEPAIVGTTIGIEFQGNTDGLKLHKCDMNGQTDLKLYVVQRSTLASRHKNIARQRLTQVAKD
jgi:hypothetical protein